MTEARAPRSGDNDRASAFRRFFARRYWLWCAGCALLSVGLQAKSVHYGLYFDDWGVMNFAQHGEFHAQQRSDAEHVAYRTRIRDEGWFPWHANVDAKIAVFRPLPLHVHAVEFRHLGERVDVMHAISLAWWGLAIFAFAWAARRLTSSALVAALAVMFYALEDGHAAAIGWLSARNLLMTAAFGAVALAAQDAWRRDGWKVGAWLCPLGLALAFLSSEAALCVVAYLACHAFFVDGSSIRRRAFGALPWLCVTALYVGYHKLAGYGVSGIGLYIDPLEHLDKSGHALVTSGPLVVVIKLLGIPPFADGPVWAPVLALGLLAAFILLLVPLLRRHRHIRFWAAGLLLAQVPLVATAPQVRFFVVSALGGSVLLAELVAHCSPRRMAHRHRLVQLGAALLALAIVVAHGPVSAAALSGDVLIDSHHNTKALDRMYAQAKTVVEGAKPNQRVVVVNAPMQAVFGAGLMMRKARNEAHPTSARILCQSSGRILVHRPTAKSLVLRAEQSCFGPDWPLYRANPLRVGESFELDGMTVRVRGVDSEGKPTIVAFEFDRPLEDPQLLWKRWNGVEFESLAPPPIGTTMEVRD